MGQCFHSQLVTQGTEEEVPSLGQSSGDGGRTERVTSIVASLNSSGA